MSHPPRKGEQPLYASAAPFREATIQWLEDHHRRQRGTQPYAHLCNDPGTGLEQLAARSGIQARSLRAYVSGERQLISLVNADRLSAALGIALWCLADEFLPRGEAVNRWLRDTEVAA